MRRRKLLIGIGAAAAGGSAAFGTEAFTSVQAERNVDVAVAGDRSSFVAIQPLDSANAGKYVDTESDNTVELELDGDNSGSGEGVAQDAITQLEDLFRVVNQGSQEVSVYFEDDSDAVSFRVTRSTGTSTNGSNGQSLEGAANSVELDVGEQVVVGMTVDTLNNDVSGQLLDSVTLYADANASAPEQSIPEPQYVVDGSGDEPNTFTDLSSALNSGEIDAGSVVGIDGSVSITESTGINISTEDVTVTGFNGRPTIDRDVQDGEFIEASADGVSIRNIEITEDVSGSGFGGERSILVSGSGITLDGVKIENQYDGDSPKGNPTIATTGEDTTITNCESVNAPISANGATGSLTLTNNYVQNVLTEGIFTFGSDSGELDLTVENNKVESHDINDENSKEIKIVDKPASINGESSAGGQIESLLTENSVNSVQVNGEVGARATPDVIGSGQQFASVNDVLSPGAQGGSQGDQDALVALFEAGEYGSASEQIFDSAITHSKADAIIKGINKPTITYTAMGEGDDSTDVKIAGANTTVQGIDFVFTNVGGVSVGGEPFLDVSGANTVIRNVDVTYDPRSGAGGPTGYVSISGDSGTTITFESCTFSDTTSGGSNRYVSANTHYSNGGTFELRNCVFNDGTRTDANVASNGTAIYKNNQFNQTPAGGADSITGSMGGGELNINGNTFASGAEMLFTSDLEGTVNGSDSGDNQAKATRLSNDNGNIKVNVNFGSTVVGDGAQ